MLRGVVFDFDGVIANSEPLHLQGFRDILKDLGLELSEADYYARYLGFDDAGVFAAVARDRGLSWTAAQIAGFIERKAVRLEALEREHSVLFPGAAAAIRRLATRGPLAIASGALRAEIVRILNREGLDGCFQLIVGAEDAEASKPSPAPYLKAVHGLSRGRGAPGEYVAVEDSHWGLESARTAGLRTVAVTNTYRAEELTADQTVSNLDELDWSELEKLVGIV
jgi:HAD superfamily hydrolase (TIGR01509 family)